MAAARSIEPNLAGSLFGSPILVPQGGHSLLAGNFSADSHPDLVVVTASFGPGGNGIGAVLLLGLGNGTFPISPTIYEVGAYPFNMVSADFNSDGKPDVAVANEAGFAILLGTGFGTFVPLPQSGLPLGGYYLCAGDFNTDGKQDLALSDVIQNEAAVFLGVGDGTFTFSAGYPLPDYPHGIIAADLDEDGNEDLVAASRTYGNLSLLRGNGDGTFQAPQVLPWLVSARADPLLTSDFNSDGHQDLVLGGDSDWYVGFIPGSGDGTFPSMFRSQMPQPGSVALASGDFNRDGHPDFAVAEYFSQSAGVFLGVGNGKFAPIPSLDLGYGPLAVTVGDFNEDGWDDLAVGGESLSISIYLNQAPFPGSCQDLDGDGFGIPGDPTCAAGALDDCDDGSAAVSPLAVDPCNGVDNDCDGEDGTDNDADGSTTCEGDCNDGVSQIHPGAREWCNGIDDDCNGTVDVPGAEGNDITFQLSAPDFDWSPSGGFGVKYNLYRGNFGGGAAYFNQACFLASLTNPAAQDAQSPSPGTGFYYLVTGRNSCGEGTLGSNSVGTPRPNNLPCP